MATDKSKIKDFFNAISNPAGGLPGANANSTPMYGKSIRDFQNPAPVNFGIPQYGSPALQALRATPPAPAAPTWGVPGGQPTVPSTPMSSAPVAPSAPGIPSSAPVAPAPAASQVPPQWVKPDGSFYTPEEIAANIAGTLKKGSGQGDIGTLAGNEFGGGEKTAEQLRAEAYQINNTRNDIAVGENDPYKVAAESGIAYTPAELKAIEQAYAGIYDPALTTALAKVEQKQIEDAAAEEARQTEARDNRLFEQSVTRDATSFENDLAKMDKQFGYDQRLKQTPTPSQSTSSASTGTYVPGENAVVDSWAQRIFDGSAKITDIPASEKGLRNQVVVALQASGNDLSGKPTSTELGTRSRQAALDLITKMDERNGTGAVGKSRIFGGSLALPGSDKANFVIDFQNLKDMLSLEGTKYLKGQGQVSDAERRILASAVTKLNLYQSEEDFKKTLNGIVESLNGGQDFNLPEDGPPQTMILNGQTLTLQPDGTYE